MAFKRSAVRTPPGSTNFFFPRFSKYCGKRERRSIVNHKCTTHQPRELIRAALNGPHIVHWIWQSEAAPPMGATFKQPSALMTPGR